MCVVWVVGGPECFACSASAGRGSRILRPEWGRGRDRLIQPHSLHALDRQHFSSSPHAHYHSGRLGASEVNGDRSCSRVLWSQAVLPLCSGE